MSAFSKPTDPLADPDVLGLLQRTGMADGLPAPGFLEGALDAASKGIPRGVLEAKATGQTVIGGATAALKSALGDMHLSISQADYEAGLGDAGFERAQASEATYEEDLKQTEAAARATSAKAAEYRADPITTGAAGQIANELYAIIPRTVAATAVGGPAAGAFAAGAPAGQAESARLQAEGVDEDTANQVGAVTGVALGVGAVLPGGGLLKGVAADTALAAAGNVGLGVAQRGSAHELLAAAGYHDQAEQYRALDATAVGTDAVFSLLLSGAHHLPTGHVDAALTNRNADSMARGDGLLPTNGRAAQAADAAKTSAISDILAGRAVNAAGHVADAEMLRDPFHKTPTLPREVHAAARAADPAADQFELAADRIVGLESGGKARAKNPASSATGAGQFIESTWLATLRRARPDLVEGKTRAQQLELRNDPDLSHEMTVELARENGAALKAAGVDVTPDTLYAAHHFGPDKAVKFAQAAGDTPMEQILTPGQMKANRYLAGKTRDQVLANWAKRAGDPVAREGDLAPGMVRLYHGGGEFDATAGEVHFSTSREYAESYAAKGAGGRVYHLDVPESLLERDIANGYPGRDHIALPAARAAKMLPVADDLVRAAEGGPGKVQGAGSALKRTAAQGEVEGRAQLPDHPDVQAAVHLAAEVPEHPILTGYDADARPVFRSLSEAVTEIQTEHAAAVNEAEAYTAGADCFLRQGAA